MKLGIDYIYIPKADITESGSTKAITKAALYFTKTYLFVVPFQSLQVLLAGVGAKSGKMKTFVDEINKQIPGFNLHDFNKLMLDKLKPEWVYSISELDIFEIQPDFWIFGKIQIRKKGGELQAIYIQSRALREEIRKFYDLV